MKLVRYLFSYGETPNSCSYSWVAYRLFVGTLVLLHNFAGMTVEQSIADHRFSQLVTLSVTFQWIKVKLGLNCLVFPTYNGESWLR